MSITNRFMQVTAKRRQGGDPVPDYIARYTMDDNSGADATENYSGTWTLTGTTTLDTIAGQVNNAQLPVFVDASTNGYGLRITGFPTHYAGVRSMAGWFRLDSKNTSLTTSSYIMNQVDGISMYMVSSMVRITLASSNAGVDLYYYARAFVDWVTPGNWYHITAVTDGVDSTAGTMAIYVNGTDVTADWSRTGGSGTSGNTATATRHINDAINARRFGRAAYDDIRFYSRALSGAEVFALYGYHG